MTEEMRKSEFADLLGVSRAYVTQLAGNKRLVLTEDGKRVCVRESLELIAKTGSADKVGVAASKALERQRAGGSGRSVHEQARAALQQTPAPPQAPAVSGISLSPEALLSSGDFLGAKNAAAAANEIRRGEDMDIELAKKRGELISKDMTIKAVADLAAATRAAYDRIPDRIATRLAAEKEPAVVYALLQDALDTASATLSKQAGDIINKL